MTLARRCDQCGTVADADALSSWLEVRKAIGGEKARDYCSMECLANAAARDAGFVKPTEWIALQK